MRARFAAAALVAVAILVFVACVGDDPGSNEGNDGGGIAPGDRGGPCKNGVCLAGLTCLDNVCVLVDGSPTNESGTSDGGGNDADPDTGSDSPSQTCNAGSSDPTKVGCFMDSCTRATQECCITGGVPSCVGLGTCTNPKIECDGVGECPNGNECCLDTTLGNTAGTCPTLAVIKPTICAASGTVCGAGQTKVCSTATDCSGSKQCKELIMSGPNNAVIKLGVCTP